MMETIMDGVNLMILGMGSVFLFLILMVVVIGIAAKLLAPYAHLLEAPAASPRPQKKSGGKMDKDLISAIVQAVQMHKDSK